MLPPASFAASSSCVPQARWIFRAGPSTQTSLPFKGLNRLWSIGMHHLCNFTLAHSSLRSGEAACQIWMKKCLADRPDHYT